MSRWHEDTSTQLQYSLHPRSQLRCLFADSSMSMAPTRIEDEALQDTQVVAACQAGDIAKPRQQNGPACWVRTKLIRAHCASIALRVDVIVIRLASRWHADAAVQVARIQLVSVLVCVVRNMGSVKQGVYRVSAGGTGLGSTYGGRNSKTIGRSVLRRAAGIQQSCHNSQDLKTCDAGVDGSTAMLLWAQQRQRTT